MQAKRFKGWKERRSHREHMYFVGMQIRDKIELERGRHTHT